MKTTLNIPISLIEKARRISGKKTKTETVITALEELVRQKRVEDIINKAGKLDFDDWDRTRHGR